MPESMSWALATQQSYAAGKAPKNYGTTQGKKKALRKYDDGKAAYKKTANPPSKTKTSGFSLAFLSGFVDEMEKIAAMSVSDVTKGIKNSTLTQKPKLVSKGQKVDLQPSANQDALISSRTISPPPVTAGGF